MAAYFDAPPSPRAHPFVASSGEFAYLWGGRGDTEPETVFIYHHARETWLRQLTEGHHPPAELSNGGCTITGQHLYLYGGWDGRSYRNGLYELSMNNWIWKKISEGGAGGPGRKCGCRMVSYQNHLLVVGGYCKDLPISKQAGSTYENGITNEVHSYNLCTGKRNYQWLSWLVKQSCVSTLSTAMYNSTNFFLLLSSSFSIRLNFIICMRCEHCKKLQNMAALRMAITNSGFYSKDLKGNLNQV